MQVNQLTNELKAAEQKYSITNEHKIALEEQIDEMRMQKGTLENLLEKEKNSKRSLQQGGLLNVFLSVIMFCFA